MRRIIKDSLETGDIIKLDIYHWNFENAPT